MRTGLRDKRMNNAGLSLVELVVVIAILAVLSAGSVTIVGAINNARTKSCAQSIYSDIGRVKINTLAKEKSTDVGSSYFKLKRDASNNIVIEEGVNGTVVEKVIGSSELTVSYEYGGSNVNLTSSSSAPAECTFDRATGGVKDRNFDTITVSGVRASYVITIYPATGKVEMERVA